MKEIERKYLARLTQPLKNPTHLLLVMQGYLIARKHVEWRLRRTDYVIPARGERYHTALKFGNGFVRREYEWEIPLWLFNLLALSVPLFLSKTRVNANGWAVDSFHHHLDGLVLAEAEVPTIDTPFPARPEGLELGREVTEERTYANKNLSKLSALEGFRLDRGRFAPLRPVPMTNRRAAA